jgi:nucleotide-binding universal stress UspA family protein
MVVHKTSTLTGEQASAARMLPTAASALLDLMHQNAEDYLRGHENQLKAEGRTAASSAYRGEPSAVIARVAEEIDADMIVLGTHGKAGMDAFWSGSITPKIARQTRIPLLLIRAVSNT